MPISTPCIGVCILDDAAGLCTGCGRTRDEIAGWVAMGEAGRRAVMDQLPARLAAVSLARPEAAARPTESRPE